MKIVREEPTLQETENYVREIDRRRGEIMKRMETNAITKEIERRLVRIMEKVRLIQGYQSTCSQGCVDIKTKVEFKYMGLILTMLK